MLGALKSITNYAGLTRSEDTSLDKYTTKKIADSDFYLDSNEFISSAQATLNNLLQEPKIAHTNRYNELVIDTSKIPQRRGWVWEHPNLCSSLPLALKKENIHLKININAICELNADYCNSGFYSEEGVQYILSNILRYNVIVNKLPKTHNPDIWIEQLMKDISPSLIPTSDGNPTFNGKPLAGNDNLIGIMINRFDYEWSCITRGIREFPENKEYVYMHPAPHNHRHATFLSFNELPSFLRDINKPPKYVSSRTNDIYSYILVFKTPDSYRSKTLENINLDSRYYKTLELVESFYLLRLMKVLLYFLPKGTFPNNINAIEIMKSQPKIYNKKSIETTLKEEFNIEPRYLNLLYDNTKSDDEIFMQLQQFKKYNINEIIRNVTGSKSGPRIKSRSASINLLSNNNEIVRSNSSRSESVISRVPSSAPSTSSPSSAPSAHRLPTAKGSRFLLTPENLISRPSTPIANTILVPQIKLRPTMNNINMSTWTFNEPVQAKGGRRTRRRRQSRRNKRRQ